MKTIYIRKLKYEEARIKLEREIHNAFTEGVNLVEVIHGIGEGKLKRLTEEFAENTDFLKLVRTDEWILPNPGATRIEILGPAKQDLKQYIHNG